MAVAVEVCESSVAPAAGLSLVAGVLPVPCAALFSVGDVCALSIASDDGCAPSFLPAAEVSLLPCAALFSAAPPHAARRRHIMMHSEIILMFFMFHLSLFWSLKCFEVMRMR